MTKIKLFVLNLAIAFTLLCICSPIHAATGDIMWQEDGIPVFFIPDNGIIQSNPVTVSDGNNGTIIAWAYKGNINDHGIRVQKLDSNGNKLWWQSGKPITSSSCIYNGLKIISDNNGGAIIAWMEDPLIYGIFKICVERIDNSGDSVWDPGYGGISVCGSLGTQNLSDIVSDGAGGVILVWEDKSNLQISNVDIYAQRVDATGNLLWGTDGLPICKAAHAQEAPKMISDGAGGAIITWQDARATNYNKDIYAQRVDPDGNFLWQENGIAICVNAGYQDKPSITTDSTDGAIIAWQDTRNTNASNVRDIYAQKINALGQIQWANNGISMCTKPGDKKSPRLVSDNACGAFVFWEELGGIFAQRVDSNGALAWDTNGISITTPGNQLINDVTQDNFFGAIIAWSGNPEDDCEIHAQNISFTGEKYWTGTEGITINGRGTGLGDARISKAINSDNIVTAWTDTRYDNGDTFAQKVSINKAPAWDLMINVLFSGYTTPVRGANLTMYRIRDELLSKSFEGKMLTYITYKNANEIGRIISKDSSLRKLMYTALTNVTGIYTNYITKRYRLGYIPITNDLFNELTVIVRRLSVLGSTNFKKDLVFVQNILNKIKGKSIAELEKIFLKTE
jgi:hypothetical protein